MKYKILAIALAAGVMLAACANASPAPTLTPLPASTLAADEEADVRDLVEGFGMKLKGVALLAPDAAQQVQQQYTGMVSPALLETWTKDVSKAPGRMVSSPWPDRIEITAVKPGGADRYFVDAYVVEITSTEIGTDSAANRIPVHIVAERVQGNWLITEYGEGQ